MLDKAEKAEKEEKERIRRGEPEKKESVMGTEEDELWEAFQRQIEDEHFETVLPESAKI